MVIEDYNNHPSLLVFAIQFKENEGFNQHVILQCSKALQLFCGITEHDSTNRYLLKELMYPQDSELFINDIHQHLKTRQYICTAVYRLKPMYATHYYSIKLTSFIHINTQNCDVFDIITVGVPVDLNSEPLDADIRDEACNKKDLSQREKEIACLILQGNTAKEIAVTLNISPETAKTHRRNIKRKLNSHNSAHLMQLLMNDASLQHR